MGLLAAQRQDEVDMLDSFKDYLFHRAVPFTFLLFVAFSLPF